MNSGISAAQVFRCCYSNIMTPKNWKWAVEHRHGLYSIALLASSSSFSYSIELTRCQEALKIHVYFWCAYNRLLLHQLIQTVDLVLLVRIKIYLRTDTTVLWGPFVSTVTSLLSTIISSQLFNYSNKIFCV